MTENDNSDQPAGFWAVVELFGHKRLAGRISEVEFAGSGMLRVDVPPAGDLPQFTRFVAPKAVYSINPCDEETARRAADQFRMRPIQLYVHEPPRLVDHSDEDTDS